MSEFITGLTLGAIGGLAMLAIVIEINGGTRTHFQAEAIENNAAHYVCDSRTGDCVFTWGPE